MPAVTRTAMVFPVARGRRGWTGERTTGRTGNSCPIDIRYSDTWGADRGGGTRTHSGVDVFAGLGTAVVAPESGQLEDAHGQNSGPYGRRLVGDSGQVWTLSHMASARAPGRVVAGELVGTVGREGSAAGTCPHLHVELRQGRTGAPQNPYALLRALEDAQERADETTARASVEIAADALDVVATVWSESGVDAAASSARTLRSSVAAARDMAATGRPDAAIASLRELATIATRAPARWGTPGDVVSRAMDALSAAGDAAVSVAVGAGTGAAIGLAIALAGFAWYLMR